MAWVEWACAVTAVRGGAPRRPPPPVHRRADCGSSGRLPGVILPPLAMILMMSTPRSARSRTAARTPSTPCRGAAEEVAMPAGRGDRRPGHQQMRQRRIAGHGVAEPERQVVAVAEVSHGGHPAPGGGAGEAQHRRERGRVVALGEPSRRVGRRVEHGVDMAVDQARAAASPRPGRRRSRPRAPRRRSDGPDGPAVEDHGRVGQEDVGLTIEEPPGPQRRDRATFGDARGGRPGRSHACQHRVARL